VFEVETDIDFSNPFNINGIPNRIIIPNLDSNSNLINYTLTKREIEKMGLLKCLEISSSDVKPFLEIILPEDNVISVESIITLNGTNSKILI
jgi:hypothetical protein